MTKILVKYLKLCIIVLLTIVCNQQGELVPDRSDVINKLSNACAELNEISKAMEAK